jgi:hypothetical protein
MHAFALPDASGYDQPTEPPTGIQHEILAVLFRVVANWRGAFGYSPAILILAFEGADAVRPLSLRGA